MLAVAVAVVVAAALAAALTGQRTWLVRASAGWFRTDARAALARAALGRADAGRRQVADRQRALSAADRALDGLRAPV